MIVEVNIYFLENEGSEIMENYYKYQNCDHFKIKQYNIIPFLQKHGVKASTSRL